MKPHPRPHQHERGYVALYLLRPSLRRALRMACEVRDLRRFLSSQVLSTRKRGPRG